MGGVIIFRSDGLTVSDSERRAPRACIIAASACAGGVGRVVHVTRQEPLPAGLCFPENILAGNLNGPPGEDVLSLKSRFDL